MSDLEGDKSTYLFNIKFNIPLRALIKEEKVQEKIEIVRPNRTVLANIESIDGYGLMELSFDKLMHTQFNLTTLNTSNMDIWLAPNDNWHLKLDEEYDLNKFNFTWNVTEFNTTMMKI